MPTPSDALTARGALERSYLFRGLAADVLDALARAAEVRQLGRDEAVFEPGDPADEICVVASGQVKDCVVNVDGDEVVHFVHGPGKTFGEPGFFAVDRHRIVRVVATSQSTIMRLHRLHLEPLIRRHPELKDRVLERLASNTRVQTNLISALATRPLADRLVLRLLELADANRPSDPTRLARTPKISQTTLAGMVGVSRENVNRALATLVASGSIRREDGSYVLVDEGALRDIAARDWLPVTLRDTGAQV